MGEDYIFVYGTLLKACASPLSELFSSQTEYVADADLQGRLYDVGRYPAAIESEDMRERVVGEVYRLKPASDLLSALDEYEGCAPDFPQPHQYHRKKLAVSCLNGVQLSVWVYVYNHSVNGLRRIESGDYVRHIQGLRR